MVAGFVVLLYLAQRDSMLLMISGHASVVLSQPRKSVPFKSYLVATCVVIWSLRRPSPVLWTALAADAVLVRQSTSRTARLRRRAWWLSNGVAVPPGSGFGTQLFETINWWADRQRLTLALVASNSENQRLYRRLGYTEIGTRSLSGGTLMMRAPCRALVAAPPSLGPPAALRCVGRQEVTKHWRRAVPEA
jgi:hypothetical protein